jgi:anti-sigma regulatory factor (Ser/Thr protein kinase)
MASLSTTVSRDTDRDVTTVTTSGTLDLRTAAVLLATLRTCVAESPVAIVIDVSDCECGAPAALSVFLTAGRRDGLRPSVPLLLCGASEEFLAGGRSLLDGISRYGNQASAARAAATIVQADHRMTLPFDRSLAAPRLAREAIARFCAARDLNHVRERAGMIVSELVTNAVIHATGDLRMDAVLRSDCLHIRVHDASSAPPVVAPPADPAQWPGDHGRGLPIVDRYSTAWGWHPSGMGDGKVVWATLRVREIASKPRRHE